VGTGNITPQIPLQLLNQLKRRAFNANRQAKAATHDQRADFYRAKHIAINLLLKNGCAFVDSVDWSEPDPCFGVTFAGGGRLHTKLSALDEMAFREVCLQLIVEVGEN